MIVKYVESPFSRTTTLLSGIPEFKSNIIKNNSIRFIVRNETKTQLRISVVSGQTVFSLDNTSPFSEENGLTMVRKVNINYFTGRQEVHNYFKLTKKQNTKALENHIVSLTEKYIIEAMHLDTFINKDTFTIEIELPDGLGG